jgi:hypothetical protein
MMKSSSHVVPRKNRKRKHQTPPATNPRQGRKFGLYGWALVAVGLLVAGGGTWAVLEFVVWNRLPAELVGTWEVQEGPMSGGTFRFSRDGTLQVRARDDAMDFNLKGSVVMIDRVLRTTTYDSLTGRDKTSRSTIRELTRTSLVLELENGELLKMARKSP